MQYIVIFREAHLYDRELLFLWCVKDEFSLILANKGYDRLQLLWNNHIIIA